jgi:hypothetical protein
MLHVVGKANIITHPSFKLPQVRMTRENCQLQSMDGWLYSIEEAFKEWNSTYKSISVTAKLARRKEVLEVWIKNPQKDIKEFGYILADWASVALQFPSNTVKGKNGLTVSEYWKQIIVSCATDFDIFSIPTADLNTLIDYCETTLEMGSIYSHALLQHLYEGRKKQSNFLGFGDTDMEGSYRILDSGTSIELANKLAIIDAAPLELPTQGAYPNKLAYLKAKLRYDMAARHRLEQALVAVATPVVPVVPVSAYPELPTIQSSVGEL